MDRGKALIVCVFFSFASPRLFMAGNWNEFNLLFLSEIHTSTMWAELLSHFCSSAGSMAAELSTSINIKEPRWDQGTFMGRAKHFFTVTDPRNVLLSNDQLEKACRIIQDYRYLRVKHTISKSSSSLWVDFVCCLVCFMLIIYYFHLSFLLCPPDRVWWPRVWRKTSSGGPNTFSTLRSIQTRGRRCCWLAACPLRCPWIWPSPAAWWPSTGEQNQEEGPLEVHTVLHAVQSPFWSRVQIPMIPHLSESQLVCELMIRKRVLELFSKESCASFQLPWSIVGGNLRTSKFWTTK